MNKRFSHFLITRFNLKNQDWDITREQEPILTDEWFEHRLYLFDNFCFPSILNQSSKFFNWFVYFDEDTPRRYRKKINEYKDSLGAFTPLYIKNHDVFLPTLVKNIKEKLEPNVEYLITSRLDNDDCLHKNFTEVIQQNNVFNESYIIDIVDGYNLQIEPYLLLAKRRQNLNPFITLVEKLPNYSTVFSKMHTEWKGEPIITIENQHLWMQIIHKKNIKNWFRPSGRLLTSLKILEDYGISKGILYNKKLSLLRVFYRNILYYINLFINMIIRILVLIKKKIKKILLEYVNDKL